MDHDCQGIMRHELGNKRPLATLAAASDEVGQTTALQHPNCPSLLLCIHKTTAKFSSDP